VRDKLFANQRYHLRMLEHVKVAIIGSGFAGLGMAIQLSRHGIDDFVVVERAGEVGGTWRDNTYPGAACDIRSDLYSFSFAPAFDWKFRYGRQPEILAYLRSTADEFGIRSRIHFDSELLDAIWDSSASLWRLHTSTSDFTASVLVSGAGPLIDPVWPKIPGIGGFAGERFHSSRWRHDIDLAGLRVAVIGTGASAIQFVPEVQKVAGEVTVFQRTPAWIVPRGDAPTTERRARLFRRLPILRRAARAWVFRSAEARFAGFRSATIGGLMQRFAAGYLRSQVADPGLRAKLTPAYRIGCKRILISSDFYRAMTRSNVRLVTDSIASVEGREIVTADGERREFDVLIGGTGFNATEPSVARLVKGVDGLSLAEAWSPHMEALHGTTVAGFPNLFLLVGPNSALGHNSIVYIIEAQIDYVLKALDAMEARGAASVVPTPEAQQRYNRRVQADLSDSVWLSGGCSSYYLDAGGRNTTLWPHRAALFRGSVRHFDSSEYRFEHPLVVAPR
jgi:cation diffusion facilitator CzcD-associated flavoprotein CzcO